MSNSTLSIVSSIVPRESGPFSDFRRLESDRSHRAATRLPRVCDSTLARYHRYLSKQLSFPFNVWYPEPTAPEEMNAYPCTVVGLIDPKSGVGDEIDGIYCTIRKGEYERDLPLIELELSPDDPNFEVVEQYWDWFWHCG